MNDLLLQKVIAIAKTDTYQIISEYVALVPEGRDYHGDCPFCGGKQVFAIAPSFGMFYCFGCGRGGTPVKFLELKTLKSSAEIAEMLAERYDIK